MCLHYLCVCVPPSYFRLEGAELVYYENEPGEKWAADNVTVKKEGRPGSVADAEAAAMAKGEELSDKDRAKALAAEQNVEVFTDKNVKGAINMSEVVDIQLSIKTAVAVSSAKTYYQALEKQASGESSVSSGIAAAKACVEAVSSGDGQLKPNAELAENMVVFKITTAKKRRYVLAVAYEQVVPAMAAFARHVAFARASLRFRREFGSGIPAIKLTLAERIAWATSGESAQMALAVLLVGYRSESFKKYVLDVELYNLGGISITPARIMTAFIISKAINEVYVANKYADREKKYGVQWEVSKRLTMTVNAGSILSIQHYFLYPQTIIALDVLFFILPLSLPFFFVVPVQTRRHCVRHLPRQVQHSNSVSPPKGGAEAPLPHVRPRGVPRLRVNDALLRSFWEEAAHLRRVHSQRWAAALAAGFRIQPKVDRYLGDGEEGCP